MKNKKGFTLVEVLAILSVLGIMVMLIFPNIGGSIESKKEKELEKTINIVESAGKAYFSFNDNIYKVELNTLINDEYITTNMTNPKTGEALDGCVRKTLNNDLYVYTYGSCEPILVPFSVELNGGESLQTFKDAYYDTTKIELKNPTHQNADFNGWKIVKGNSLLKGNTLVIGTTETILYAVYEEWGELTIDLDGGTVSNNQNGKYKAGTLIELETPTKTGYTFTGWSASGTGTILSGNKLTIGIGDVTVTANWNINSYVVNYNYGNNYISTKDSVIAIINNRTFYKKYDGDAFVAYVYRGTYTGPLLVGTTPESVAYYTTYDYVTQSTSGNFVYNGKTYYYSSAGQWMEGNLLDTSGLNRKKYNALLADAALQLVKDSTTYLTYGSTITLSNPTKTGYTFTGWSASGTGVVLSGNKLTIGIGDVTVTANWNINSYVVNYNYGNNYISTKDSVIAVINNRTFYKKYDGAAFVGYVYDGSYTGPLLVGTTPESVAFYSSYNTSQTHTSSNSFQYNGRTYYYSKREHWWAGDLQDTSGLNRKKYNALLAEAALQLVKDSTSYLTYGSTITLSNPTRTGYTFTGWSASGTGVVLSGNKLTIGIGDVTVTANWNINSYVVNYNYGNNYISTKDSVIAVINNRTFYKKYDGAAFVGYVYDGSYTGPLLVGTTPESVAFYSSYDTNQIHTSSNSFQYNGRTYYYSKRDHWWGGDFQDTSGLNIKKYNMLIADAALQLVKDSTSYLTYGSTITLSNPTKTGYTFTGWSASGTGAILSGNKLTIGIGDVTVTANYTINTYTINYVLNGGNYGAYAPTSGAYGSTVTVSNPTRTGYTFTGWTVSGTGASMSGTNLTIGLGNITLTANWIINNTIPEFTYTGSYQIVDDSNNVISTSTGNWKIRFLTSGTLVFTNLRGAASGIDVFLVGGGGGGALQYGFIGGGGGGGYTTTVRRIPVSINVGYSITIGLGGAGAVTANGGADDGQTTYGFNYHAEGGKGNGGGGTNIGHFRGGNGGSGGGSGYCDGSEGCLYITSGVGGYDGSDGFGSNPGRGQGTTTREFGETSGMLYAAGGGGGGNSYGGPGSGANNTGGGGNGTRKGGAASDGFSGIVVIRNAR